MVQGFLKATQHRDMEINEECFNDLATHSVFQDFRRDGDGNIIKCKMHDIVHDFVQFLTKSESFLVEVNGAEEPLKDDYDEKGCHSMLMLREKAPLPDCIKKLRSLLIESTNKNSAIMNASLLGCLIS